MDDTAIFIGSGANGTNPQQLELSRANRHGPIAGFLDLRLPLF